MKVDLNGQVALVTGGAQGIGRAIAELLAANGAHVVIVDTDVEAGEQTARELSSLGSPCLAVRGDVSDHQQMEQAVSQVLDRLGRIDILVNNAGINTRRERVPIHE